MSLFGTSPDESAPTAISARSRVSLFDDEPSPAAGSKSSLFADEADVPGSSPWAMPTPKKSSRDDMIKSLLAASDVPDSYIDTFDNMLKAGDDVDGKIGPSGVSSVLSAGKISADDQARIMNIIAPGGHVAALGRNEFNVLLALIGLAQEREDITLDGVDERRRSLPEPKLPSLSVLPTSLPGTSDLAAKPAQRPFTPRSQAAPPSKTQIVQKETIDDADPWGSPAMHANHDHGTSNGSNGHPNSSANPPVRTTSTFTTSSRAGSSDGITSRTSEGPAAGGPWGSYDADTATKFAAGPGLSGGGFTGGAGEEGPFRPAAAAASRALGGGRTTGGAVEETVQIILLPEKEGMFMFQHHNYEVASVRRGSKVIRRYSDFVWLLDCLQKRYPFRQLPLLPPKRVAVNGNHLAADNTFIEKRRRGLVRFTNALVQHPILSQEQLVIIFLTVPTHQELAVWRKQATISVQEEFVGRNLPPELEDSLSPSLDELFEKTKSGVRRSTEIYINLCVLMDRLAKRNEGLAADHARLSLSLQSLTETSQDTYATDTNDVPLLNEGLISTAKHVSNSQALLGDEARAWDMGVLEDLKRQRDALVSMRDMFDRRDRYDKDNIPQLERRISANETKLAGLKAKPEGLIKPGEIDKVTESIIKDKQSIVAQHARGVFIKECIRDELLFFQQSQYHVSRWNQDWAQERVKYSELQADNWKQLHEQLESMPLGD
ncbi:MAG: Sorting nexin mvp1 [Claussenomyces sp. TS43310]|nr:MAG: Sorting nexin mvp1 [Claussenomyces sp. TS43310]